MSIANVLTVLSKRRVRELEKFSVARSEPGAREVSGGNSEAKELGHSRAWNVHRTQHVLVLQRTVRRISTTMERGTNKERRGGK